MKKLSGCIWCVAAILAITFAGCGGGGKPDPGKASTGPAPTMADPSSFGAGGLSPGATPENPTAGATGGATTTPPATK
jgi:hypothetical protein